MSYNFVPNSMHTEKLYNRLSSSEMHFLTETVVLRFWAYRQRTMFILGSFEKRVVDFLLVLSVNWTFSLGVTQHTVACSWMYRAINEQHSAVGRSLSLDQPSGIHFQTSSEMRLRTHFDSHWKHCFSDNISVLSALEVLTTMRYVNRYFTYLLRGG